MRPLPRVSPRFPDSGHKPDSAAHPGHSERRAQQAPEQRLPERLHPSAPAAALRVQQPAPLTRAAPGGRRCRCPLYILSVHPPYLFKTPRPRRMPLLLYVGNADRSSRLLGSADRPWRPAWLPTRSSTEPAINLSKYRAALFCVRAEQRKVHCHKVLARLGLAGWQPGRGSWEVVVAGASPRTLASAKERRASSSCFPITVLSVLGNGWLGGGGGTLSMTCIL